MSPRPWNPFPVLTFPVDPRTKQRVQQELKSVQSDLPLVSNDSVDGVIAYLQNHSRGYIENVLRGKGTYGEIIGEALRKEGVPQDLIFLAAGESAFNPFAASNKQCVGIWQFSQGPVLSTDYEKPHGWMSARTRINHLLLPPII